MTVNPKIKLDLQRPTPLQIIHAKQGESYTRAVEIELYSGGQAWTPPTGATYQVCYRKPDGKGGTYSTYQADGENHAVTAAGNVLTVTLIPQMLEVAGMVHCEVHMQSSAIMAYVEMLSTFTFFVSVQASAESGITSTDYWASARTDKVVLLNANVSATADATATHNVSTFLSTPHVGDAVVGANGYAAVATQASGSTVTIKATGVRWLDAVPSSRTVNGKSLDQNIRLTASDIDYQTQIGDEQTQSVDDALGLLEARSGVYTVTATRAEGVAASADKTVAEIAAAISKGQVVRCLYIDNVANVRVYLPVADVEIGDTGTMITFAQFAQTLAAGKQLIKLLAWDNAGASDSWLVQSSSVSSGDVTYSGNVANVSTVKAALDALAVGNPLDMTADYTASGATSVEQWATMAAETEDADDDAEATYRVNAGRYRIAVTADQEASDVTIMDVPDGTGRIVLISHINSDPFWYFDVYGVSAPGGDPESLLSLSTEEGLLNFGDGCVRLLPGYDKSADSDDADKILMLKRSTVGGNTSVNPQWVALTNVAEEGA